MSIFEQRRKRAQELMVQRDVTALQVTSRENYFYLTGDVRIVDSGPHSLHLHGATLRRRIEAGDLVVIDVHPLVDMYACDTARTVVCGPASPEEKAVIKLYAEVQANVVEAMRPGWKVRQVTEMFSRLFTERGYGPHWISGPIHGVGLEFEEWPHPSHYPAHLQLEMKENWALAIGHSLLTARFVGGIRIEDTILLSQREDEYLSRTPRGPD